MAHKIYLNEGENIYFTSDLHFEHKNVKEFCPKFRTNDEDLIKLWNSKVTPKDTVIHLGDFLFYGNKEQVAGLLNQLNGKIYFILGNHDNPLEKSKQFLLNNKKADGHYMAYKIAHYEKFRIKEFGKEEQLVVCNHYPMFEWDQCHRGSWQLHGHIHNRIVPVKGKTLNVGYDLHGKLLSMADLHYYLDHLPVIQHHSDFNLIGFDNSPEAIRNHIDSFNFSIDSDLILSIEEERAKDNENKYKL